MIENIALSLSQSECRIEEAPVFTDSGAEFWHSAVLGRDLAPISAGFARNRLDARKIAIAEYLERTTYRSIALSGPAIRASWGLDLIPTACGFAAGFDEKNTILRSLHESAERWVMSKWIDDGYSIEEISADQIVPELDAVSKFLISAFDSVRFFKKNILIQTQRSIVQITVGQTMAFKDDGIFPGSSSQFTGGSLWQHALLESFRHLLLVKNNPERTNVFPDNKIIFFSKNAVLAVRQIEAAKIKQWPDPTVRLHQVASYAEGQYFVARTILDGWRTWNEGPMERFLY